MLFRNPGSIASRIFRQARNATTGDPPPPVCLYLETVDDVGLLRRVVEAALAGLAAQEALVHHLLHHRVAELGVRAACDGLEEENHKERPEQTKKKKKKDEGGAREGGARTRQSLVTLQKEHTNAVLEGLAQVVGDVVSNINANLPAHACENARVCCWRNS